MAYSIYNTGRDLMVDDARALADYAHMSTVHSQYILAICEDLWKYNEGIVWC